MKPITFLIYCLLSEIVLGTQAFGTQHVKYIKRMIQPSLYNDFASADDTESGGGGGGSGSNEQNPGGPGCTSHKSCNADLSSGNSKQKATNIAQKAAQEAKAASEAQQEAGQAAAHQVKMQLAEKAVQAAKAAEAALAGKQQIVEQLQQEVHEAEGVVQEQGASLQNAQQYVQAASQAAQQAQAQLKTLTSAVQMAQSNVGNSEQAAVGAQQELLEKNQLLDAAKCRVEELLRQLNVAKNDFAVTKQAAYKAACAANEAKVNAQRARRQMVERYFTPQLMRKLQEHKQHERMARQPYY